MLFEQKTRLVMVGDSITDAGRDYGAKPAAVGSHGDGYVNLVNAFLTGCCPENQVMVVNKGVSGNTIRDIKKRWKQDVLDMNPDWVSIMIGVNDAWRHFDGVLMQTDQVYYEEFEETYRRILDMTKGKVKGIIVMAPFIMEPNKQDKMRLMVEGFAYVAKKVAAEYGAVFVDTQKAVDEYLKVLSPYLITQDRVHPNLSGHMIIAKEFLKAVQVNW